MKHTCASTEALTRKVTKAQISANFILNEQKSISLIKYYALDDKRSFTISNDSTENSELHYLSSFFARFTRVSNNLYLNHFHLNDTFCSSLR